MLSAAVFHVERKPALSGVEGDLARIAGAKLDRTTLRKWKI
jgi:hypothetical protein